MPNGRVINFVSLILFDDFRQLSKNSAQSFRTVFKINPSRHRVIDHLAVIRDVSTETRPRFLHLLQTIRNFLLKLKHKWILKQIKLPKTIKLLRSKITSWPI